MIKKHNNLWIIWILFVSLLLTGCWDYTDIEKKSIVVSIGIDRVKDQIEFSGEVAKLVPQMGEKKEEAKQTNVYTDLSYGKDFEEARIHYDGKRPYPTFLGATRVVVFGTNFAKEGIEPYINRINNIYDYRKTMLAVISREPPKELFEVKVENDISVGFLIENMINSLSKKGRSLYPTIGDILSSITLKDLGYVLPYIGIEEGGIKYLGFAVMKDSKLIDTIPVEDSSGILYLLAEKPSLIEGIPSFRDDKNILSFRVTLNKRKIKTNYINGKVHINIDLDLKSELRYQYYVNPINDEEIKKLENSLSKKIKKDILDIIKKSQNEYKCCIFGFQKYFRADNPKIHEKLDWGEAYPKADIDVSVKVKIVNQNLRDPNAKMKY